MIQGYSTFNKPISIGLNTLTFLCEIIQCCEQALNQNARRTLMNTTRKLMSCLIHEEAGDEAGI
uniref:Uncharacterized protein n=1 Tax=Anguilla anguilla TaxID=7936 RepID=A0A0E9TYA1_ANGAN